MAIYPNIYQTLVPCPIVELRGYLAACGLKGRLYAYLDYNGPTGTSRDSVAEGMLALAAEKHKLLPGQPIIEAASGSFAMALVPSWPKLLLLISCLAVCIPHGHTSGKGKSSTM